MNQSLSLSDNKEIESIVFQLKKDYKPELIMIFGSYATGKINADSDVDILIVKKTKKRPIWRRVEARKSIETDLPIDILVYTPEEYAKLAKTSLFIKSIIAQGKILYNKNDR